MDSLPPDQERIVRLLALKRHETPPPGYFHRFPDQVILHLRAGRTPAVEPWWSRLREWLATEPALAGSYAMLVTGGLLFALSAYHLSDRGGAGLPPHAGTAFFSGVQPVPGLWEGVTGVPRRPEAETYVAATNEAGVFRAAPALHHR
jgi:hypothetical protein